MTEPWMIDELAYAGPEHLDPAFVAGYDRKQGFPDPGEDLAIFEAHGLGRTSAVLDLGAGSGQFALAAARRFGHVTAVDVSPAMNALLRERAAAAGLNNLDCVRAGFLSYDHPGPPVDGVYTRNALHQLPDFWKAVALARIADAMRPGGVLRLHDLIYDFSPAQAPGVFQGWMDHAASDPAAGYTGADYAEHIRTEFSTFRWLLEPILAATGFQIVTAEYDRRLYGTYTCLSTPVLGATAERVWTGHGAVGQYGGMRMPWIPAEYERVCGECGHAWRVPRVAARPYRGRPGRRRGADAAGEPCGVERNGVHGQAGQAQGRGRSGARRQPHGR